MSESITAGMAKIIRKLSLQNWELGIYTYLSDLRHFPIGFIIIFFNKDKR